MKKIKLNSLIKNFFLQISILLITINKAYAYIGLGPLVPMIGTIIAYIFIGFISLFGIIIYPVRMIFKKIKNKKNNIHNNKKKYKEVKD